MVNWVIKSYHPPIYIYSKYQALDLAMGVCGNVSCNIGKSGEAMMSPPENNGGHYCPSLYGSNCHTSRRPSCVANLQLGHVSRRPGC